MIKSYIKFTFGIILMAALFLNYSFFLSPASASTKDNIDEQLQMAGGEAWGTIPEKESLATIIQYAISAFLGLLGIIFIVLIIYAGFNWMTAGGDEEKVTKAKETLTRAVIGLIIIIAAYSITYFVFNALPDSGNPGGGG